MAFVGGEPDCQDEFPDGGINVWAQTRLLIAKNWKCKLRADKKKLAGV